MRKERCITERMTKNGLAFDLQIKYIDENGKRDTYNKTFNSCDYPTNKMALDMACKHRDEVEPLLKSGKYLKLFPTVKTLYEQRFELYPLSIKTRKRHDVMYRQVIGEKLGNTRINEIKLIDIQQKVNEYAKTHSTDATNRCLLPWKDVYKVVELREINVPDLLKKIIFPKGQVPTKKRYTKTKCITNEDFMLFMDFFYSYAKDSKESVRYNNRIAWYMLWVMYYTGMRPAEVMALTKQDVDFHNMTISINKEIGSNEVKTRVVISTKTEDSERVIPMVDKLAEIFKEVIDFAQTDKLFYTYEKLPVSIDWFSNLISNVSDASGIIFNSYMLRHKMSTDLIRSNTDSRTVQDILGHSEYSMSLYYAESQELDRKEALEKLKR